MKTYTFTDEQLVELKRLREEYSRIVEEGNQRMSAERDAYNAAKKVYEEKRDELIPFETAVRETGQAMRAAYDREKPAVDVAQGKVWDYIKTIHPVKPDEQTARLRDDNTLVVYEPGEHRAPEDDDCDCENCRARREGGAKLAELLGQLFAQQN